MTFNGVGEISKPARQIGSVQSVGFLPALLFKVDNALLGEHLQMTRDDRCVDAAALAEAHGVFRGLAAAQFIDERESVELPQSLEQIGDLLDIGISHI